MQPVALPFGTAHSEATGSLSSVMEAGSSTGHNHTRDNPIQQRARAWAQQRQQEQSVLSLTQHDASESRLLLRSHSGVPDAPASRTHQSSSQPGHDRWRPQQSPRGGAPLPHTLGLSRQQSEPSTSMDEEWPVLGTPPMALHLPHGVSPLHLPPPSPVSAPQQTPPAVGTSTPAAFGLQWAANLARGAEWMGEATGLRFLTRPFSRTVAGMTGTALVATGAPSPPQVDPNDPSPSTGPRASLDGRASPVRHNRASPVRSTSMEAHVSALAPSPGSMSYRERLLAGSNGQANGQANGQNMVRISPSKAPPQGSQIGFPSQQELQATHGTSSQPSSSSYSAAGGPSSSSVPAVSALSLRHESPPEAAAEALTPAGQRSSSSAAFAGSDNTAPHAVSVLPEAAQVLLCCTRRGHA